MSADAVEAARSAAAPQPPDRSPGLDLFRLGAFTALGVPVGADPDRALWAAEKALSRVRGGLSPVASPLLPWLPAPDEIEVRQAAQRLEEPLARAADALLAFDLPTDPRADRLRAALADPAGEAAARLLASPEAGGLVERLHDANLRLVVGWGILHGLVPAGVAPGGAPSGPGAAAWTEDGGRHWTADPHRLAAVSVEGAARALIQGALEGWSTALRDPAFAERARALLGEGEAPQEGDVEALQAAVQARLADAVAGEVRLLVGRGRLDHAAALSALFTASGLDAGIWRLAVRPVRAHFASALEALAPLVDEGKPAHLEDVRLYLKRIRALAAPWRELDRDGALGLAVLADDAALRAFERVRALDAPATQVDAVDAVLGDAEATVSAESARERIRAYRERLRKRKEALCHYCQKREMELEYCATETGRQITGVERSFNSTTTRYRYVHVPISRCRPCAEQHEYLRRLRIGCGVTTAAAVAALALVLPPSVTTGAWFPILGLGAAALVLVTFAVPDLVERAILPPGERPRSAWGSSPADAALRKEGYTDFFVNHHLHAWSDPKQKKDPGVGLRGGWVMSVAMFVVVLLLRLACS